MMSKFIPKTPPITVAGAMISADGPQPLWRKILMKFIELLNNPDFDTWHGLTGDAMPQLHWHAYTFLERIFNHFASFATNFNNVNVISKERPISELDVKPLVKAMLVFRTIEEQLTLHMSQMIPITIQAVNVSKFSLSPYNKTNACPPVASSVSDNSSPESRGPSANKRTPSSPTDLATKEATNTQRKKKSRRNGIRHFSQIDDLPAEVAPLMGGKDGPGKPSGTRKTA